MSYQDPHDPRYRRGSVDPRTQRYESGYDPNTAAYSQMPPRSPHEQAPYEQAPYDQTPYDQTQPPAHLRGAGSQARAAQPARPRKRLGPDIVPGLFIGGVVTTGVVTGLAAWLVAWIIRTIAIRVNEAGNLGVWNPVARDEYWFAIVGFLCALAAGALWYALQLVTPSPDQFFRWIMGLLIAAAVIIPLLLSAEISAGIGTAVMHLVIGVPLFALIPAMGHKSIRGATG